MAEAKTNVMRLLEQKKVPYQAHSYPHDGGAVDGVTVAGMIGRDRARFEQVLLCFCDPGHSRA